MLAAAGDRRPSPVPHFDRAAFDGYALRAEETFGAGPYNPLTLRVVGEAHARPAVRPTRRAGRGGPHHDRLADPGRGRRRVLPAEAAEEAGGVLTVVEPVVARQERRPDRRGRPRRPDRARRRPRVFDRRTWGCCRPSASARVEVIRRPRVAILVTGDEILPPGSKPEGYRIVDSNSVVLAGPGAARRRRAAADQTPARPAGRDPEAMTADDWDVLLVSGGTSVGREDHAPRLVAELGELPVHGVALRPASPAGVGFIGGRPVFLLPGNPVACLCAYDLFAGRAVRRLGGRSGRFAVSDGRAPGRGQIESRSGRVEYVRVTDGPDGVRPVPLIGASMLSSTVIADGFVVVPPDRDGLVIGESVTVYRYD